jgi:hypothetical protein
MEFVALVIAALALAPTACSAHQPREHHRLSVRLQRHLFHSFGGDEDRRGVCLRNVGLGSAQIAAVDVLFDDPPFARTIAEWSRVLSETFSRLAIRASYGCMYERSQPDSRSSFLRVPE